MVQKLFPRVPHVKDPVGDSFQNERMVGGRRCAGGCRGVGEVWGRAPRPGIGAEGGALPAGGGRATCWAGELAPEARV